MSIAVVTGASGGIGAEIAKRLAQDGFSVALIYNRNAEKAQKTADEITLSGGSAKTYKCDVRDSSEITSAIEAIERDFGEISVLVNNAGISMRALFVDLELDVIRRLMDVNFWGTVYCTKFALPYILKTKGSLVGIISVAGFLGLPGRTGYSASKFAVRGFLNTLRVENLKKGLHVLVAAPGFTASNIRKTAFCSPAVSRASFCFKSIVFHSLPSAALSKRPHVQGSFFPKLISILSAG